MTAHKTTHSIIVSCGEVYPNGYGMDLDFLFAGGDIAARKALAARLLEELEARFTVELEEQASVSSTVLSVRLQNYDDDFAFENDKTVRLIQAAVRAVHAPLCAPALIDAIVEGCNLLPSSSVRGLRRYGSITPFYPSYARYHHGELAPAVFPDHLARLRAVWKPLLDHALAKPARIGVSAPADIKALHFDLLPIETIVAMEAVIQVDSRRKTINLSEVMADYGSGAIISVLKTLEGKGFIAEVGLPVGVLENGGAGWDGTALGRRGPRTLRISRDWVMSLI
jgi:hypothetical protein